MKVIIIRANFRSGLSAVERSAGQNENLPVLKNVLIEATDGGIVVTTTNLEIAATYRIPGKIIEKGKVSVPINLLSSIINNLQSERLNLEKKGNNLEIKTDNYEAVVDGSPTEEFPIIPKIKDSGESIEIEQEILTTALGQVVVSTQFSEIHPELNSILFKFGVDHLTLAGSDSFRLGEKTLKEGQFSTNHKKEFSMLVPLKTSNELTRVLEGSEQVKISHDENQILFKTPNFEFVSRLVDGTFPDYQAIIPDKFGAEVLMNREECMNALKLAGVFGTRAQEIRLKPTENKRALEIFSAEQGVGGNKYLLPAKIQGKAKETSFNWRYLLDGLRTLESEDVFLGLNEENKPALLRSPQEGSYFYILMPVFKV